MHPVMVLYQRPSNNGLAIESMVVTTAVTHVTQANSQSLIDKNRLYWRFFMPVGPQNLP